MIRTVIEVSGEDNWKFEQELKATLDKLGYEPKRDADYGRFMSTLFEELRERGLDPTKLVEERQDRQRNERIKARTVSASQ